METVALEFGSDGSDVAGTDFPLFFGLPLRRMSYIRPTSIPKTPPSLRSPILLSPGHLALWST